MTHRTRQLLARFFKVQPGFLVDDAEGYQSELGSHLRVEDASIDSWLYAGAEKFHDDAEFAKALQAVGDFSDTRKALLLLGEIVKVPGLIDHLYDTLKSGSREAVKS
jgi:hypothetical protein